MEWGSGSCGPAAVGRSMRSNCLNMQIMLSTMFFCTSSKRFGAVSLLHRVLYLETVTVHVQVCVCVCLMTLFKLIHIIQRYVTDKCHCHCCMFLKHFTCTHVNGNCPSAVYPRGSNLVVRSQKELLRVESHVGVYSVRQMWSV